MEVELVEVLTRVSSQLQGALHSIHQYTEEVNKVGRQGGREANVWRKGINKLN